MKNGRYSDAQIMAGPVALLCRSECSFKPLSVRTRLGFSSPMLSDGGVDASLITEMKDMAEQNRRLKKMYAEMSMQNDLLKETLGKKR